MTNKLAIGCAQFGLPYGITNMYGAVDPSCVASILDYAKRQQISTLDTAITYGNSESVLGEIGINDWQVISKLPALPSSETDISSWIFEQVKASLNRLNITSLGGLLLHSPDDLLGDRGFQLVRAIESLKLSGLIKKAGISIYQPCKLQEYLNVMIPEIVQCPFNVLDHRLVSSGWAEKLNNKNIEVHVRSVFLQGILLADKSVRPPYFDKWNSVWDKWDLMLNKNNLSPLQACLNDVIFNPLFHKVIVGVNELSELKEIVNFCKNGKFFEIPDISINDINLINPSYWK